MLKYCELKWGIIMKIESKRNIVNINENLNIIMSTFKSTERNYYVSIILRDKENIRHCVNIFVELMKDNQVKIPSTITVSTNIINKFNSKHSLEFRQICDDISIHYDESVFEEEKLDAKNTEAKDIIDIINNYLNSFDDLHDDINLKKGLEYINTSLTIIIEYLLEFWQEFDIDSYINQQQGVIMDYQKEYIDKVTPIQDQINLLKDLQSKKTK